MRKMWDFSFANCLTLDWAYYNPRKYNIYLFVAAVHYTVYSQCTLYSTDRTALNWETVCWGILVSSRCYLESLSETQRGLLWRVLFTNHVFSSPKIEISTPLSQWSDIASRGSNINIMHIFLRPARAWAWWGARTAWSGSRSRTPWSPGRTSPAVQYSTVQYSTVQAELHRLRLQELGEVEGYGGEEARHDVAHRALGVADQSAQRSGS